MEVSFNPQAVTDAIAKQFATGGAIEHTFSAAILDAIEAATANAATAKTDIEQAGTQWTLDAENTSLVPMLNGTATNRLALTATRDISIDAITGNATIEQEGFKAFFADYSKLKGGLQTSTSKLLDALAIELTRINSYRPPEGAAIKTLVSIPLDEYIARTPAGKDLAPRETHTPEEAAAERSRIENIYHNARKKINTDLAVLYSLSLSWKEPKGSGRKSAKDYADIRIIQSKGIRNGAINVRFGDDIADYLTHAYVMQYPQALLALEEGNSNKYAYRLGRALALRASMDNNAAQGTANIISVEKALEYCGDLPTYEEIQQKDRGHWEHRIKDPLELALNNLVAGGVLDKWEYCNSKNAALTDDQIEIPDYPTFAALYIHFEIANASDQSARRERRAEEKAKAASKKKRAGGHKKTENT